jgi:hypothetical protein
MTNVSSRNDLRVFAARSRRGSSVGRTRGCSGSMRRYGDFNRGAWCRGRGSPLRGCRPRSRSRISRLKASYLSGRRCQPGQSSGYWLRWRQRNPLAFRGAQRQDQAAAEAGGSGSWSHGLRSGEFADENEPPLVTVRTDHRLNQWHRFCVSRYKRRVDGVLRRLKLGQCLQS